MKLLVQTFLVVWLAVSKHARAGNPHPATVPGTGWTDISQVQSTCSQPGYFVNPSDCSRFYCCVDHSTPEHTLLLRYDFDCPGGLAFDESTKNCNYPGPSGCVTSGGSSSGWGWNEHSSHNHHHHGIFQSSKGPSAWGSQTNHPAVGTTIVHVPSSGGTIIRGPSTTATPYPSTIVQIPGHNWESLRLRPSQATTTQILQSARISDGGGWSQNPGVIHSAKVTTQHGASVAWGGAAKIFPQNSQVFQSARVTPVPITQWETPQAFPQSVNVIERQGAGWSNTVRITPTPRPANPIVTQSWQSARITQVPQAPVSWQKITQTHQQIHQPQQQQTQYAWEAPQATHFVQADPPKASNPSINFIQSSPTQAPLTSFNYVQSQHARPSIIQETPTPPISQSLNIVQEHPSKDAHQSVSFIQSESPHDVGHNVHYVQPINPPPSSGISHNHIHEHRVPANPTVTVLSGWENVRISQLPSGYTWQSSPNSQVAHTNTVIASTPIAPTVSPASQPNSLSHGDFGIIQQVIDEQQVQGDVNRKSHIQLVYENRDRQLAQHQSQIIVPRNQANQQIISQDPSNPVYEFTSPSDSGLKGRIIVLYAPLNRGGKREVPVIEVEVEEDEDDDDNNGNDNNKESPNA